MRAFVSAWLAAFAQVAVAEPVDGAIIEALARAEAGDHAAAAALLEGARARDPSSPLVAREHAIALVALGRFEAAREAAERAIALGDPDPEAYELLARILGELGDDEGAIEAAERAGTWAADLIAAALGDRAAAHRSSRFTEEQSARGALASLALATHAAAEGERTTARNLVDLSEHIARADGAERVAGAARALRVRIEGGAGERVKLAARARSSVDYATNPLFSPTRRPGERPYTVLAALGAELAAQLPISTARFDAAVRVDQRVHLIDRDRFDGLDLTSLGLAASVEVPISSKPRAALVGLTLRLHDVWGDAFAVHWASAFELGATLALPIGGATRVVLGVHGVGVDFIDGSPPDASISSQNRDRVGQRASLALLHEGGWFDVRGEAAFTRDDAFGEAFDARGGVVAGRVSARIIDGVELHTGLAVWLRSFGPVGDAIVLEDASTRLEVRTVVEIGARVALSEAIALVARDDWIHNDARQGHEYTHNVLSLGLEARW